MPQVALDSGTTPAADVTASSVTLLPAAQTQQLSTTLIALSEPFHQPDSRQSVQTSEINTPYGPFIILPGKSPSSPSFDERHSAPTADFCFSSYRLARIPQHRIGNNTKSYVPPP
ncbi:hypothetical protein BBAD15_g1971 [Beauveria bassiana D1-5]|uniref:Uncharacterized protein n=1 Tax=Beauveria bassiana D1-5 TaxID=1245745 RepID=A0A0A2VWM1_BEABA|nr:hypothetical protein BBAD15_g1971 [Beauveria bassiana D1-5]